MRLQRTRRCCTVSTSSCSLTISCISWTIWEIFGMSFSLNGSSNMMRRCVILELFWMFMDISLKFGTYMGLLSHCTTQV